MSTPLETATLTFRSPGMWIGSGVTDRLLITKGSVPLPQFSHEKPPTYRIQRRKGLNSLCTQLGWLAWEQHSELACQGDSVVMFPRDTIGCHRREDAPVGSRGALKGVPSSPSQQERRQLHCRVLECDSPSEFYCGGRELHPFHTHTHLLMTFTGGNELLKHAAKG